MDVGCSLTFIFQCIRSTEEGKKKKIMEKRKEFWISLIIGVLFLVYLIQAGQEQDKRCARDPTCNECVERSIGLDYDM